MSDVANTDEAMLEIRAMPVQTYMNRYAVNGRGTPAGSNWPDLGEPGLPSSAEYLLVTPLRG